MMNENIYAKKANLLFLTVVILALFANLFVSLLSIKDIAIPIVLNLLVSQLIILIPGLIFFLDLSKDGGFPGIYGKIRFVSIPLLIVFTWLVMPLVMAANVFSQIFTKNDNASYFGSHIEEGIRIEYFIYNFMFNRIYYSYNIFMGNDKINYYS